MNKYVEKRKNYVITSESLHKPLFSIFIDNVYSPHVSKPKHYHPDIEIMFIKSGRGKMKCRDKIYEFTSGDVFLFRSMEPHRISETESKHPTKYICFSFSKNIIISEKGGWIDKSILNIIEDNTKDFSNKLTIDPKTKAIVKKLVSDIEREHREEVVKNSYVLIAKFAEIITRISSNYVVSPGKSIENTYHKDIDRSVIYMNEHISEPITLSDLANVAKMGVSHYSTTFRKMMGTSPWQYFLELRVNLAIKYLTDKKTHYKITEISSMCGFNNTSNFNKMFHNITGKAPSDYRKSQLRDDKT